MTIACVPCELENRERHDDYVLSISMIIYVYAFSLYWQVMQAD